MNTYQNHCPQCNAELSSNTKFCAQCGFDLETEQTPTCPTCGKTFPIGTKFCSEDGSELTVSELFDDQDTEFDSDEETDNPPKNIMYYLKIVLIVIGSLYFVVRVGAPLVKPVVEWVSEQYNQIIGQSKKELERLVKVDVQRKMKTNTKVKEYNEMEVLSVSLVKSGKNTYDGFVKISWRGEDHEVPITVTTDGFSFTWKMEPFFWSLQ